MQKSTRLGAALLTAGAGSALSTAAAADHGQTAAAVVTGLFAGACAALGITSLIVGWAVRPMDADPSVCENEEV